MKPDEYEIMFRVEETHWWYRASHRLVFDALEQELPNWREKNVLDAGCGTGAVLKQLGNPDKNIGIDLAPEALAFCRKRGLSNVREGDICALPFRDESFDAVICSSVFYHEWVSDLPRALSELNRVLRPGGLLFINVPAFRFLHSPHDEAVMTACRFTKRELRQLLKRNNFQLRRLSYWTTLLFPLAVVARTFGGSKMGRDFENVGTSLGQRVLGKIMQVELSLLKRFSFPFGVALFALARK